MVHRGEMSNIVQMVIKDNFERDIIMESGRWNNGAAKNLIIKEKDVLCWGRAEINF